MIKGIQLLDVDDRTADKGLVTSSSIPAARHHAQVAHNPP